MAKELDDLNSAVAGMADAVTSIEDYIKNNPAGGTIGIDPAAVESAAVSINGLVDRLKAAIPSVVTIPVVQPASVPVIDTVNTPVGSNGRPPVTG